MRRASFAELRPLLCHVTERSALPSIERHGLLSAAALCELYGLDADERHALLSANRSAWRRLSNLAYDEAWLRRQFLPDAPLQARLAPGLTAEAWRRFINDRVFLSVSLADAGRLRRFEAPRDQVVLQWRTGDLLEQGLQLNGCRFNNGMIDRSPPGRRRLRSPGDYQDVRGEPAPGAVKEVAILHGIPPELQFTVVDVTPSGTEPCAPPARRR